MTTLTINSIADDDIIDAMENSAGVTITGTFEADTGQTLATLEVTVDGVTYILGTDAELTAMLTMAPNYTWELDLSMVTLSEGALSVDVMATDSGGESAMADRTFTVDTMADADNDLSVTFDDMLINDTESGGISVTVAGLDADATGTLTISTDGGATTQTASVSANGVVAGIDISALEDGNLTATLDVTDTAGNMASASGNSAVLDTSSDADATPLSIVIDGGDAYVNEDEVAMTDYTVAGLDSDVTSALVTFSDGDVANDVTATISENGTFSADLSGLDQGNITVTIVATDLAGNTDGTADDTAILDTIDPDDLTVQGTDNVAIAEFTEPGTAAFVAGEGTLLATFNPTDSGAAPKLTYAVTSVTGTDGTVLTNAVELVDTGAGGWELRVVEADLFDHEDHPEILVNIDTVSYTHLTLPTKA